MGKEKTNNKKIGLALGGGSALGFAHVGVLKALEENNIAVDFISGTSAGAIIGALYAFGVSIKEIEEISAGLDWLKLAKIRPSKMGITNNDGIREILEKHISKEADISEAGIPLAIVATDIETGAKIVFKSGNAINAVLASSCLPGLFSPIEMNGCLLVDGGIVENVPLSPLKGFESDILIGVNLLRHRRYTRPTNIMGILTNSFDMINHRISAQPRQGDANILIEPDLREYFMGDIKKWKEISSKGYTETLKYISAIKDLQKEPARKDFWQIIKDIFRPQ